MAPEAAEEARPVEQVDTVSLCWQRRRSCLALAGTMLWPWQAARAAAGGRIALVIGNVRYAQAPLANAANDARLMVQTLNELGFETRLLLDASLPDMLQAVRAWLSDTAQAEVRLLYFAGHGAQFRGRNFLIPVDAQLRSEDDLPGSALNVDDLVDRLSRFERGVNVVVLDACRSIAASTRPGTRMRGTSAVLPSTGLSALRAPRGTVVAYATSPGAVAADGAGAANSTYTRHLSTQLKTPGLPIEAVFKRTRAAVLQESGGTQIPWESSSLVNDFCFSQGPAGCG